jgi:hypothetical protein
VFRFNSKYVMHGGTTCFDRRPTTEGALRAAFLSFGGDQRSP